MKVLVVGGGGREHAIAWALAQSKHQPEILVAPGNPGMASFARCVPISVDDIPALLKMAQAEAVDLTVVGPELPLTLGIVDQFQAVGLPIFGPSQMAAQLESSKAFAKAFMDRHHIPTAKWRAFTDAAAALNYLQDHDLPVVIKADGLAAGKGVVIAQARDEARRTVMEFMSDRRLGAAGQLIVIEQFLQGREVSLIAVSDGETALLLDSAADHKRAFDGDLGPNTGGMGAYSPVPWVDEPLLERVRTEVLEPTIHGMATDGMPFTGFLYMGIMVADGQPYTLEYNVRLGDPEAQALLPRLKTDLLELCARGAAKALYQQSALLWDPCVSLCVVMAAEGYPGAVESGHEITGIPADAPTLHVFQAGTRSDHGKVVTNGGRVLAVTALSESYSGARHMVYQAAAKIRWQGAWYRHDIGKAVSDE